jgi:hypothetical protein
MTNIALLTLKDRKDEIFSILARIDMLNINENFDVKFGSESDGDNR